MKQFLTILLAAPLAAAPPSAFREHTIGTGLKGGYQVAVVDLNRDKRPDLIALASGMTELVWYENPGWQRHVLATGLSRMINLAAADTDGDGIPEIVIGHEFANAARNSAGIVSLLKCVDDPRQPWAVKEIDRLPTSHRLRVADIDGNRRPVFVNAPLTASTAEAPEFRGRTPLVFYRPGEWRRERVAEEEDGVVHGLNVFDWNGDGKDDILTASFTGVHVHLSRGSGRFERVRLTAADPAPYPKGGASEIAVGHLGKRRFLATIEPWHGNQVCVYQGRGTSWRRIVIDDKLVDGHTVAAADLDGDRRDELIAGFRGAGRSVYVYRAADKAGAKWARVTLDDGGMAAAACVAADLNADGKTDIACIGAATANLKWYENVAR
jgi:hypothetical protein